MSEMGAEYIKFCEWIDTSVIAAAIFEKLSEYGYATSSSNAKRVWTDFLITELSNGLDSSIKALDINEELSK